MPKAKDKIVFICTGNSCRSQMAEAFMEKYHGDRYQAFSAGTNPSEVKPRAIKVLQEKGLDISKNSSKHISELPFTTADYVITVCDDAMENCPFFPATKKALHHSFDDPPALEKDEESEVEKLHHYRRVRDEIEAYIRQLPDLLNRENEVGINL